MKPNLSPKEKIVLQILAENPTDPPTYDELRERLGLKSRSGIHGYIIRLEDKGYITRTPSAKKSIRVIGGICQCCGQEIEG